MDDRFTLASTFLALGSLVALVGMAHELDVVMLRGGEVYDNMKLMAGTFERFLEVPRRLREAFEVGSSGSERTWSREVTLRRRGSDEEGVKAE